jgi:hypothetical protein
MDHTSSVDFRIGIETVIGIGMGSAADPYLATLSGMTGSVAPGGKTGNVAPGGKTGNVFGRGFCCAVHGSCTKCLLIVKIICRTRYLVCY